MEMEPLSQRNCLAALTPQSSGISKWGKVTLDGPKTPWAQDICLQKQKADTLTTRLVAAGLSISNTAWRWHHDVICTKHGAFLLWMALSPSPLTDTLPLPPHGDTIWASD